MTSFGVNSSMKDGSTGRAAIAIPLCRLSGEIVGPCGRNNWSTSHLAIAGSPVVVFFSEQPVAVGNRYPVAIVKP